ncbi:MAG: hypothetical protein ACK56F_29875 [bacterium]
MDLLPLSLKHLNLYIDLEYLADLSRFFGFDIRLFAPPIFINFRETPPFGLSKGGVNNFRDSTLCSLNSFEKDYIQTVNLSAF